MTEEIKIETKEEKTCNCVLCSEGFKKFLIVAGGTFVGAFCALSLFAALHRPPMPPCPMNAPMMRPPMMQPHHFDKFERGHRGEFRQDIKFNKAHREGFKKEFKHQRGMEKPPVDVKN